VKETHVNEAQRLLHLIEDDYAFHFNTGGDSVAETPTSTTDTTDTDITADAVETDSEDTSTTDSE